MNFKRETQPRTYLDNIFPPEKQSIKYSLPESGQTHSFMKWDGAGKPTKSLLILFPESKLLLLVTQEAYTLI